MRIKERVCYLQGSQGQETKNNQHVCLTLDHFLIFFFFNKIYCGYNPCLLIDLLAQTRIANI